MAGMTQQQMADLIREHGARRMAECVGDFAKQFVAGVRAGWDLSNWTIRQAPGVVLFLQTAPAPAGNGRLISGEPRILVVNAPEEERERWTADLAASDAPVLLIMQPQR